MNKKKYAITGILLIVVSSVLVSGSVFTVLFNSTITANADVLMTIDSTNAEDYALPLTTSTIVAGETEGSEYAWSVSNNLNSGLGLDIDFAYSVNAGSDDLTGIDLYVYFDDGTTNTTVISVIDGTLTDDNAITGLAGGDSGTLYYKIVADDHLEQGTYIWDISCDVTQIAEIIP